MAFVCHSQEDLGEPAVAGGEALQSSRMNFSFHMALILLPSR